MHPAHLEQRPRRPADSRAALLAAATELFAAHGFDGVSVSDIAEKAGVNRAMISYHFGGKRDLYAAILAATFQEIVADVERIAGSEGPAPEVLRAIVAAIGDAATHRHPHFCTMMLREVLTGGQHMATAVLAQPARVLAAVQRVVERGYEAGANVQGFLDAAQQDVFGAAQGQGVETLKPVAEPVMRALENLEAVQKRVQAGLSPMTGVPTGIATLDRNTLGLQPGSLVVLAARPSVGKTALALNVAVHAATKHRKKVAFFSLEMPSEQLALRMLAAEAKLDWRRLTQGQLQKYDWDKIATQADRIGGASIWLDDTFVLSPVELRSKCRKLKRENGGLDLVVVDYLQLMHAPSERSSQSREQEIATIRRSLKSLAKELEVPVVALSQLNRGVEKRKGEPPMLSDLRESGAIEQDADVVLFLHRSEDDSREVQGGGAIPDTQQVQLIIAKQRQGPTGVVDLVFFRTTTFFAEMKREGGA